ncbi:MAG: hypothetical protein AABY15_07055 [Nanoarchaeota archaeon]
MEDIEDIEFVEFFEVGDKVTCLGEFGIVVKTYDLDKRGVVIGGSLIVLWDSDVELDFENCSGDMERLLKRVDKNHQFKYIT